MAVSKHKPFKQAAAPPSIQAATLPTAGEMGRSSCSRLHHRPTLSQKSTTQQLDVLYASSASAPTWRTSLLKPPFVSICATSHPFSLHSPDRSRPSSGLEVSSGESRKRRGRVQSSAYKQQPKDQTSHLASTAGTGPCARRTPGQKKGICSRSLLSPLFAYLPLLH